MQPFRLFTSPENSGRTRHCRVPTDMGGRDESRPCGEAAIGRRGVIHGSRWMTILLLGLMLLAACNGEETVVPTPIDPDALATERAANSTATAIMQMTLVTLTPTPTRTPSHTPTPSLTPTFTPSRTLTPTITVTPSPTITLTPSFTPTDTVEFIPTETPTMTFTPSLSPTRVLNPDALVGQIPAPLRIDPAADAIAIAELPPNTALGIDARTPDDAWLQIHLLNGQGNGWVAITDLIVFVNLDDVPLAAGFVTPTPSPTPIFGLPTPQTVTDETAGTGADFLDYNYFTCGDTYWEGDDLGFSMEDLAFDGRYPRFAVDPVRVYVHGLDTVGAERDAWELAISQSFAELSQALRLERVLLDDLEFFQPSVPMETILADRRVDMVWHVSNAASFADNAPCSDPYICSQYAFRGAVRGGPLRFGSATFISTDAPDRKAALLEAAIHALGLWVQSAQPDDIAAVDGGATRLSPRDVATLRCLYNAPPYGDAVLDE